VSKPALPQLTPFYRLDVPLYAHCVCDVIIVCISYRMLLTFAAIFHLLALDYVMQLLTLSCLKGCVDKSHDYFSQIFSI